MPYTPKRSGLQSTSPVRLLLVDDDPSVVRGLKRIVTALHPDWDICTAPNGVEAIQLLNASVFDVVVTDLQMPTMDGLQLLRHMMRYHPDTRRIVHSSHIETLGAELVRYLAHRVIAKPADTHQVIAALEWAALRARSLRPKASYA